ncbi:MAG: YDG domain-containing protein [Verrucomicrobiota bacterium]
MRTGKRWLLAAVAVLLSAATAAEAATFTAASAGAWNLGATWGNAGNNTAGSGYPGASDVAVIPTGKSVTGLGGSSQACTTLTLQGTGSLLVDANTLTVSGVTTIGSSGAANLTISAGATFSSTSTASGAYVFGGTGSSITNNGTFTCTGGNGSGGTTPIFQNNGTLTFSGSQQEFNSAVAVIQGASATLTLGSTSTTPFGGSSTLNAAASGNTVSYASGATIKVTTYYNLTLNPSGTQNWQGGASTIAGTLTVAGTGNLGNLSGLTLSGNLVVGGSGQVTANASLNVGGNVTVNSGILYAQYGINVAGTTTLNSGTLQLGNQSSGSATFTGDFSVSGGTFLSNYSGQNDAVTFGGNLTVSSGTFTAGTGVHTFSGSGKTINGTITIPNLAVTGSVTNMGTLTVGTALTGAGTLTQNANTTLNLGGTSTIATLAAAVNTPNTVAYTGTGAQSVKAITYYNLTASGGNTKTLAGAVIVNATLTIAASTTLADAGNTLTANAAVINNGTHSGAGRISLSGGSTSHSLSGTGTYQNLELNDANGASIAAGTATISATGTLTLTSGTLGTSGGALSLASGATVARSAGSLSLTPTFSTSVNLVYNDTSATATGSELPASATVLNNLTINNAAGVTLNANATLKGTLALTSGKLITGANMVTVTSTGTITGGSASSYVYGRLDRGFTTGSGKSASFPVGDSTTYAPVSLSSATVSVAGNLGVSTIANNNSQGAFSSSGLSQVKFLNRDWTLTAANGFAQSAGSITLNFVPGDLQGSMSTTTDVAARYAGGTWTKPVVAGRTATSITLSGVTSFGDWVVGELPVPVFSVSPKAVNYGAASISLTGTMSANSGTVYPVSGSAVSASINGHAVSGTFTDSTGDFTILYNHASLATDTVADSPYTITYSFAGDANLAAAVNDVSTGLTVNQAPLSLAANNKSKTYGSALTLDGAVDFIATGLQNGETIGSVTLTPSGGTAATDPVSGSPYTIVPSDAVGGTFNPANYTAITYNPGSLTINPLPVQLTGSRPYDGTADAAAEILAVANAVSGDTVTVASGSAGLAGKNAPSQVIASFDLLVLGNNDSGNYTLSTASGSVTITPLSLSVAGLTANDKSYDGTNTATLNTTNGVSFPELIGSDSVTLNTNSVIATFESSYTGTNLAVTVSGLALDGADAANYTLTQPAGLAASITPAPLSVTGILAAGKTYDGTTNAVLDLSAAVLSGVLDMDTNNVTLDTNSVTGGFADANAGTNKTVLVDGFVLGGDAATNYSLTQPTATATILPATLTASVTVSNKVYDGNTDATLSGESLTGVFGSDDVSVIGGIASFEDKNAGAGKPVGVTGLSLTGTAAGNYALSGDPVATTADITARPLIVSATAEGKIYDGALDAAVTLSDDRLSSDVLGVNYTTALFGDRNVGIGKTVTVSGISLSGDDAGNYSANPIATAAADIAVRPLTVSAVADSKIYDGSIVSLQAPAIVLGSLAGGDAPSFVQNFDNQNTGTGKTLTATGVVVDGNGGANYGVSFETVATGVIAPRTLTVSATDTARTYGLPNPQFTASYAGFASGDTSGVLSGSPDLSTTATQTSAPGNYPITAAPGSLAAANYVFTFADGTLTVGDPVLLSIANPEPGQYVLSFPTLAGQSYQVESSTDLSGGSWLPLGDAISGTGDDITTTNSIPGEHSFFRLNIQLQ